MILVDHQIEKLCSGWNEDPTLMYTTFGSVWIDSIGPMIEPFSPACAEPGKIGHGLTHAGYDIRLGNEAMIFDNLNIEWICDPRKMKEESYKDKFFQHLEEMDDGEAVNIPPGSFALCSSLEYFRVPKNVKGRVTGKSTYARCGVFLNLTAMEPGWCGRLSMCIANLSKSPMRLVVGEGIGQAEFDVLAGSPDNPYEGKYQGDRGVSVSKVA